MIAYIENLMQAQAKAAQEQGATEEQFQQLEMTKKALDNMKIQRGMATDQEKLKLDAQKIAASGWPRKRHRQPSAHAVL